MLGGSPNPNSEVIVYPDYEATYTVTNLNDSGEGSLRWALEADEPRKVVFAVAGTITLTNDATSKSRIYPKPYVDIKGETAPNGGICVKGGIVFENSHTAIMRHLRIRPGGDVYLPGSHSPIVITTGSHDLLFEHLSLSWGTDGLFTVSSSGNPHGDCYNITLRWSFLTEALHDSTHPKGPHSTGLLLGAGWDNVSCHHNLLYAIVDRVPNVNGTPAPACNLEYSNNVLFLASQPMQFYGYLNANIDRNMFRKGSGFWAADVKLISNATTAPASELYFAGNKSEYAHIQDMTIEEGTPNYPRAAERKTLPFDAPILSGDEIQTYLDVLAYAGAIEPVRDAVDTRVVAHVHNRTGAVIDDPSEVGGWPDLTA